MDWFIHDVKLNEWSEDQYKQYVAESLDTFGKNITARCLELYPYDGNARLALDHVITDSRVTCGNDLIVKASATALESGVYRYYVTSRPSRPLHPFGLPFPSSNAFHGWDMFAFFEEIRYWMDGSEPSELDDNFTRLIQENVMHFVYHGKPKDSDWLEYPTTAIIESDKITYKQNFMQEKCDFWMNNGFFNYTWST